MIREAVTDANRETKIEEIQASLGNSQMERGTHTYGALDYICDIIEKNDESVLTALFDRVVKLRIRAYPSKFRKLKKKCKFLTNLQIKKKILENIKIKTNI